MPNGMVAWFPTSLCADQPYRSPSTGDMVFCCTTKQAWLVMPIGFREIQDSRWQWRSEEEEALMDVIECIDSLIRAEERKDDCGQIHLTSEEQAIFQEAGINEGSYAAIGHNNSSGWCVVRETFDAWIERYPGEYLYHVNKRREANAQRKKKETRK
jgi:hypothetical protein